MNPPTKCPVCEKTLVLMIDNYWRCPDAKFFGSDSKHHNFEYFHHNESEFQIILYWLAFKIVYWFGIYREPLVDIRINRAEDQHDEQLFRGNLDFDWSKILTDFPTVKKKLQLWKTFE